MKPITAKATLLTLSLLLAVSLSACGTKAPDSGATAAETTEAVDAPEPSDTPSTAAAESTTAQTTTSAVEETAPEIDYRDIDVQALADSGAAIVHTTVYGIYSMEGEAADSAIQADVYYDLDQGNVVRIDFEEALLPCSQGGAEGWAILGEAAAAALGDAVLALGDNSYPLRFELAGITWNGAEKDGSVVYTASIDGQEQNFLDYVASAEGGAWYHSHRSEGASLLDANGQSAAVITIETKASIGHGVDFWSSPITFPGNIELIKNYIYDHGITYDYAPNGGDIVKDEEGRWVVADTVTGATLAGAPNYFNLVKQAVEQIQAGTYDTIN